VKHLVRLFPLVLCTLATGVAHASADTMPSDTSMPMYHHTSYRGAPDLNLALAVVLAGGGPAHFDASTLVGVLGGSMTKAEVAKLTREYGAAKVSSFLATFTFAINDVLRIVQEKKIALPSDPIPDPKDGGRLTAALVWAGTMPNGRFDVGYMIEHMISHDLHVVLMHDINNNPAFGPAANANFHVILTRAVLDLKSAYGL
jgi:hypothetical protein